MSNEAAIPQALSDYYSAFGTLDVRAILLLQQLVPRTRDFTAARLASR
jgi:hypothetical protein